ncbi:hypothetical protein OG949_03115 [Streptomyces scopuliridis]|uniref:hypothetical protein n=1 Tax=Streptomyces scopuliridis TaxID=452529 RepID=UPI002DDB8752|nr:hypothetical protein [Streptomyces scopuliridis]WSB31949.1 hypothetical protein OG949_03115 [Streptomyces scopuliridis]
MSGARCPARDGSAALLSRSRLLIASTANASAVVPVAALFLGFGAGAGVTPGLFLAGFSVPSAQIGPTFALVELLRPKPRSWLVPFCCTSP